MLVAIQEYIACFAEPLAVELFGVVMSRELAHKVLKVSEPLAEKTGIVELEEAEGAFQHSSREHPGQEAENAEKAREQTAVSEVQGLQVETADINNCVRSIP